MLLLLLLKRTAAKFLVFLICLIFSSIALAIDSIQVSIEHVLFPAQAELKPSDNHTRQLFKELHIDQLELEFDFSSSPARLEIDLAKLKLPEPYSGFRSLKIICQSLSIQTDEVSCAKGQLTALGLLHKELETKADFFLNYNTTTGILKLNLNDLTIGDGRISIQLALDDNHWQADIEANNVEYQYLENYFLYYLGDAARTIKEAGARTSFTARLSGIIDGGVQLVEFNGSFEDIHYLQGDNIGEKLGFNLQFKVHQVASQSFQVSFAVKQAKGEVYQNEIYAVFTGKERLSGELTYHQANNSIELSSLRFFIPEIINFNSSGLIELASSSMSKNFSLPRLTAVVDIINLQRLSRLYLENMIEGTNYEGLQIEGKFKGQFNKNNHLIASSAQLNGMSLAFLEHEQQEQLSLAGLNGKIHWNNYQQKKLPVPESYFSWQQAALNKLPLGPATFNFVTHSDQVTLTRETHIPVFDGALQISSLDINHIGQSSEQNNPLNKTIEAKQSMTLVVDGMIKPISLELVSEHFGWPVLDGTLSAVIPATTYNEHYLNVGGAMLLGAFEGEIIIKDLNIEQPLQDYARLSANIDLNNLNLKSLTKTYNFGEIEGRVEGKFSNLVLQSWQPVAFDAYIRTPEKDNSRHRISQKAIDNLSSLGGASGLLSRSFLSIFETFGYDKIGLSCKLKNNVCTMNGVEPKGNSYYIVKGGGIPRIDVMGFQNQVNWQILISRLKAIQSANKPVIQ